MSTKCPEVPRQSIKRFSILALLLGALVRASGVPVLAAPGLGPAATTGSLISPPNVAPSSISNPAIGAAGGNPLWGIPLHTMSATRERPLFSPSRRPPSRPIVAAAPPSPSPSKPPPPAVPPLTLVGTVLGGSEDVGVFVEQATKNVIRLRVGEGHDDWRLRSLQARAAILEQGRRRATLALSPRDVAIREASVAPPKAVAPSPSASQRPEEKPAVPPPGTWLDGDGRVISPPSSRETARNTPGRRWTDGDARPISPSIARPVVTAPSRASNTWADGDGQLITPPSRQVRQIAQP